MTYTSILYCNTIAAIPSWIVSALKLVGELLLSVAVDKGVEILIDTIESNEMNIIEEIVFLREEIKKYDSLGIGVETANNGFMSYLESIEGLEPSLNILQNRFGITVTDAATFHELMTQASSWSELPSSKEEENYKTVKDAAAVVNTVRQLDGYRMYFNDSYYLTKEVEHKQESQDYYNAVVSRLDFYDQNFPHLSKATEGLSSDLPNYETYAVLGAIEEVLTQLDTEVVGIVETNTSLIDSITTLTGTNNDLQLLNTNLNAAIQNIPNTIATMAPIYPVCSCGAGSTAGVSDGVSGETFVDDIVSGVVTGVGRMEVKVNEQVFGEMVDRRNNQNLKNALAGRGFSWV